MSSRINDNNTNSFIYCLSIETQNDIRQKDPSNVSSICFAKRILDSLTEINRDSKIFETENIEMMSQNDIESAIVKNRKIIIKAVIDKATDAAPEEKIKRKEKSQIKSALKRSLSDPNNIKNALDRLKIMSDKLKVINDSYQEAKNFSENYLEEKIIMSESSDLSIHQKFKEMSDLIILHLPPVWDCLPNEEKTILKKQYRITQKEIQELQKPLLEGKFRLCLKLQEEVDALLQKQTYKMLSNNEELKQKIGSKLGSLLVLMKSNEGVKYREKYSMQAFALADRASKLGIKIDTSNI